jgi:hypothetical protein
MDALNGRQYDGRDLRITMDAGRPSRSIFVSGSVADPDPKTSVSGIGFAGSRIADPKPIFLRA